MNKVLNNIETPSLPSSNHSSQAKSDNDIDFLDSLIEFEKISKMIMFLCNSLEIDKEVTEFSLILSRKNFAKISTRQFWSKYKLTLSNLYKLFFCVLTISASISGVVCKQGK